MGGSKITWVLKPLTRTKRPQRKVFLAPISVKVYLEITFHVTFTNVCFQSWVLPAHDTRGVYSFLEKFF